MSDLGESIKEKKDLIRASLWIMPATSDALKQRDFLNNFSQEGVDRLLMQLEKDGSVYFKKIRGMEVFYTKKSWIKKNRPDLIQ